MSERLQQCRQRKPYFLIILPRLGTRLELKHHRHQIAEAYRRYGISPSTKDLIVVKVAIDGEPSYQSISDHISKNIEGDQLPVTDQNLAAATDMSKVSKYYKLNGLKWLDSIKDQSAKHKELEMLVLGSMALRGV